MGRRGAAMLSLPFRKTAVGALSMPVLSGAGLAAGLAYAVAFAFGFMSFTDPDYWWHVRTGRLVLDEAAIPRADVYSFTAAGERWVTHEWLSEVLIYLGVSTIGYAATLAAVSLVILASFELLRRALLRHGVPPLAASGAVLLGIVISSPFWTVRPQVLSWALVAVFLTVLWGRRAPPWPLVAAMALWANLHLGFVLGLALVALWAAARLWDEASRHGRAGLAGAAARDALLFAGACVAATLLNPNGPLLLLHALPFAPVVGGSIDLNVVTEWQSPDFHEPAQLSLLAGLVGLLGLALAGGRITDRFLLLATLLFAAMALYASRYQPLFALVFVPAAGLAAASLLPRPAPLTAPHSAANWSLLTVVALVAVAAIPSLPNAQLSRQPLVDGSVPYPAAEVALLQDERPEARVFAEYQWGGYVLHGLYPRGRVFIDGRADMYGSDVFTAYRETIAANDGWQATLTASGADAVLVSAESALAEALASEAGWRMAYEGPVAQVYLRER